VHFHRDHPGELAYLAEARIFSRDFKGKVVGVRYNDRASAPLDLPESLIEPCLSAVTSFVERLCNPAFQLRIHLRPGDLLVFDNHRVLHGRTAFDPTKANRLLRSCSVDRDATQSHFRVLAQRFAPEEARLLLPQGSGF
jgi:gamma-butyrobetaine dioxygenase